MIYSSYKRRIKKICNKMRTSNEQNWYHCTKIINSIGWWQDKIRKFCYHNFDHQTSLDSAPGRKCTPSWFWPNGIPVTPFRIMWWNMFHRTGAQVPNMEKFTAVVKQSSDWRKIIKSLWRKERFSGFPWRKNTQKYQLERFTSFDKFDSLDINTL